MSVQPKLPQIVPTGAISTAIEYLVCPDDHGGLLPSDGNIRCTTCGRIFLVHDNIVELLPAQPTSLPPGAVSEEYKKAYLEEFALPFRFTSGALAWGAPESMDAAWVEKRNRQVRHIARLLSGYTGLANSTICDFSGGAGYYSLVFAPQVKCVLHCDLSVDSLNYVRMRAKKLAVDNIVLLRIDYFRPPFRRSLPYIFCFDTLIRGEGHELALLQSIRESLQPAGRAYIDFHNWMHNPLRRLGLLAENFGDNRSYTRREAASLLARSALRQIRSAPFRQEFDPDSPLARLWAIVPATRHVYEVSGDRLEDTEITASTPPRRTRTSRGRFIAFLGPDGAGKSSIIERLARTSYPRHTTEIFHWSPLHRKSNHTGDIVTDPGNQPSRGTFQSFLKLLYLWVVFSSGYLRQVRPALKSGRTVLFDRYYFDLLVDPKRYRFSGCQRLARLVGKLIPQPDLVVFLDAPVEVIARRKQEVTGEEAMRQRNAYLRLAAQLPNARIVDATRPPSEIAGIIERRRIS